MVSTVKCLKGNRDHVFLWLYSNSLDGSGVKHFDHMMCFLSVSWHFRNPLWHIFVIWPSYSSLAVGSIRYLTHVFFLVFLQNIRMRSFYEHISFVICWFWELSHIWTAFLEVSRWRRLGSKVHYIKHEVKQCQIFHDAAGPFRSTFVTVVMRSLFCI